MNFENVTHDKEHSSCAKIKLNKFLVLLRQFTSNRH